jgi:hypothetical protein
MAYTTAEGRSDILDAVAEATREIALALAALGVAYEELDESSADRLEESLFRPVQAALGRVRRTGDDFAARVGLPARPYTAPPAPSAVAGARELMADAVDAIEAADEALIELQDSLLPVEVGDPEVRAGLSAVRELLTPLPHRASELLRLLGR